jgi:hypothetical protein
MANAPEEKNKNWQWWVERFLVPLLVVIVAAYISTAGIFKQLKITIVNQLALPVVVTVNNSYSNRIQPNESRTITLFSDDEFPANVKWKVERNKNSSGALIGEEIGEEIKLVDKGAKIKVDNEIGLTTYFYPVIMNNTDSKCFITVNDGLSISYDIGASSPHTFTNITGYYKYATNSNVTLKCSDQTYWLGKRNGKKSDGKIDLAFGSGVLEMEIPNPK